MASITVDQLQVLVTANAKDLDKTLSNISSQMAGVEKDTGKLGVAFNKFTSVAKVAIIATGAAAATGVGMAVKAFANYEQLVGGVETLFKDSSGQLMKYANGAYKTAGLSANQYMEQATSFSATLLQGLKGDTEAAVKYADMAITDMSDNANKMGTDIGLIQNAYQGFAKDNYTMLDNLKLGYGGTATEMARLVNESGVMGKSFKATAENVKDIPFDKLITAIHQTQKEMGITGTTAKEASETISGSWKSVKSSFENVLTGIEGSGEAFGVTMLNLFGQLADKVPKIAADMARGMYTAFNTIIKKTDWDAVYKSLVPSEEIRNSITKVFDYLAPKIVALATAIQTQLVPVLTSWQNVLLPLVSIMGTALVVALGLALDVTTLFLQAITALYEILEPFTPVILGLVVAYTAYQVIAGIVTGVQLALNGVMVAGTTGNAAYALGVGAVTLAQTAAATATTLWHSALSLLNPVTLGLAAAVTAVVLAVEAVKLAQMNANLEAQNTITMEEREAQLRLMTKDAINAQKEALEGYTSAKQEETNAALALMNAEDQETAAKGRLDDMIRNGVDPASREYKRAQLELEAASGRVMSAQDKLSDSSGVAKEKFDDVGDAVWAQIRASKEDELQKLAQAGKYDEVNQKLRDLAKETHNYKDANGEMTKFSAKDMNTMALAIGDSLSDVHKDYRKFWDASQQSVDKAARNVAEVKSQFTASGRSFSQGVADGILADSWRAENAARTVAYRANAAFNAAQDSHSPSRVMMKSGGYFSQGVAVGIKDKTSEVIDAAHTMANKLTKATDFSALSDVSLGNFDSSVNVQHGFSDFTDSGNSQPLIINVGGERLVDTVIQGINGRSFLGGSSVINV